MDPCKGKYCEVFLKEMEKSMDKKMQKPAKEMQDMVKQMKKESSDRVDGVMKIVSLLVPHETPRHI